MTEGAAGDTAPGVRATRVQARAHPRSAGSRCSGVWSPAPPPSARTGFGLSGTARTLRGETRWRSCSVTPWLPPAAGGSRPSPYLAAPASDSWCLKLSAGRSSGPPGSPAAGLRVPGADSGRGRGTGTAPPGPGAEASPLCVPWSPQQPATDQNSAPASTVGPWTDVTGAGPRAPKNGQSRRTAPAGAP